MVAVPTELKLKVKIMNTGSDFISLHTGQCVFEVNGKKMPVEEDLVVVGPNESKGKVIRTVGTNLNDIRSFKFKLGGLSRVEQSSPLIVEAFRLPASENSFMAGPFRMDLEKVSKTTKATQVVFKATYEGENDFGVIYPSNISVLMPDGKTYASMKTRYKHHDVSKGKTVDFIALWESMPGGAENDMQKVDMMIQFNKVFFETSSKEIPDYNLEFNFDENLTRAAN